MKKIALLFALVLFGGAAYAQDAPAAQDKKVAPAAVSPAQSDSDTRIQALEMQVRTLADEVAALQSELRELRKASSSAPTAPARALLTSSNMEPGAPPIADAQSSSEVAAPAPPTTQTQTFGGATSNAKLLNPDISLIGDFIGAAGHNRVAPSRSI
jgi:TolA-binding protein